MTAAATDMFKRQVDEWVISRNPVPAFEQVVGQWTFDVVGIEKERPTLWSCWLGIIACIGQRQCHVGVAQEFTLGSSLERQPVGWDQKSVAQLRDVVQVIRKRLTAVKEWPAGWG